MGKIYIPIGIENDIELTETIEVLHKMKVERAFLAMPRLPFVRNTQREEIMCRVKEMKAKLLENGIKSAVWITTLGFGVKSTLVNAEATKNFVRKKSINGVVFDDCLCPMDKNFVVALGEIIQDIAKTGVDMIVLDDELCLSAVPGVGCACLYKLQSR